MRGGGHIHIYIYIYILYTDICTHIHTEIWGYLGIFRVKQGHRFPKKFACWGYGVGGVGIAVSVNRICRLGNIVRGLGQRNLCSSVG